MLTRFLRTGRAAELYHQHRWFIAIALTGAVIWLQEQVTGQHWHF